MHMLDEFVKDKFERPIISLRITITNRCNENCIYCHHDGMVSSKDEMTPDEIYKICKIAKRLGVKKIRLSGGDPLVRKDIVEIVEKIASLDFKDISLTTNGVLLGKYAESLKDAGLDRVNVSLDTLNRDTYKFVTNMDYLNDAKEGILKAVEVGLYPVKINMVVMKDINQNEIKDMFYFCKEHNIVLQLIELIESENCDDDKFNAEYHYPLDSIEKRLLDMADDDIILNYNITSLTDDSLRNWRGTEDNKTFIDYLEEVYPESSVKERLMANLRLSGISEETLQKIRDNLLE